MSATVVTVLPNGTPARMMACCAQGCDRGSAIIWLHEPQGFLGFAACATPEHIDEVRQIVRKNR
jgi:hypothetical protein